MNRDFPSSDLSDSVKLSQFNQAGLQEAQQNYFLKYANSGFSEVNNIQRAVKRVDTKIISPEPAGFNKIKNNQNEVLRQLKQEYQILRNLPIDDKIELKPKQNRQIAASDYSSSIDDRSQVTSSKRSQHKKGSRDAQILALEKKQLQIVISNSLKKIQQLLQNEMELKKTIHQLRLQIQGKGGINSQYQMQIRNFKKKEKQLNENIETLKLQIQRKNSAIKQLGEKVAFLQGQKSRRQQQHRGFFDNQRKMDDLIRKQKDKSMNAQLQSKRIQMQFQIYQKDKTAQITRLTRELQAKRQAPQKDAQMIKRLQDEIRNKDHKIQNFVEQIETLRGQINTRPVSPPPQQQDNNKKILQELVKQMKAKQLSAKDNNEAIVRAFIDKIGTRKDQGLKNQLSSLRVQMQTIRRNSALSEWQSNPNQQGQLRGRIRQLQKIIDEQKRQKRALLQQIDKLKSQRESIQQECQSHRKKVKQYRLTEQQLLMEIQSLGNFKIQLQQSKMQNQGIKQKLEQIMIGHQIHVETVKDESLRRVESGLSQTIQQYQDEIRGLKRKIDQLALALNKANQQRIFSETMLKQAHGKELSGVNADLYRYKELLKNKEDQITRVTKQLRAEIEGKNKEIQSLKQRFEDLDKRNRQTLQGSRSNYQSLLKAEVAKHHNQLQAMNQKIIQLTKTNETFSSQSQYYQRIQREAIQLRRLTRNQKRTNEAVDHLWQIKEAEYGNINEILSSIRN